MDEDGDMILAGLIGGSPRVLQFSKDPFDGSISASTEYIKFGEVITSSTKGAVVLRAGSIIGYSLIYDVDSGTGIDDTVSLDIRKNGGVVWEVFLQVITAGNDKESYGTQARGTDTFAAGDNLAISFREQGGESCILGSALFILEIVYD